MLSELEGRVAVVTGAASGIGAALCRRLAREGMVVVAADVDAEGLAAVTEPIGAVAVPTDVADADAVTALADAAYAVAGHVDLLCNNAGVFQAGQAWEATDADWRWAIDVNLLGIVHGLQAFVPRMLAQGTDGHVVNTASVAALVTGPFSAPYVVTKSAVLALSECLAHDLAAVGARIGASVLLPSAVDTAIAGSARVRPARFGVDGTSSGAMASEFLAGMTAAGLAPDDVVDPVLDAVRTGTFLIPTRPSFSEQLQVRHDALVDRRLPAGVPVD